MKKQHYLKKPLAALLALVMTLTLAPAASAAASQCPMCRNYTYERTVVHEANCHEAGLAKYVCSAPSCGYGTVEDIPIDQYNHDIVYSDNGDGTHSGVCRYHSDTTTSPAAHKYTANGICELCGVSNYSAAAMDLPSERIVPVVLGDASAKLTADDVRITLGTSNITEDYDLSFLWYQDSRLVGEGSEYQLPSSVYNTEGTYYVILIVNAQPKTSGSRVPLSQTCRVTVRVAEMISVSAVMSSSDGALRLGSSTVWTTEPIANQIYDGVQRICGRTAEPTSVVFTDVPVSSVGRLNATTSPYTFGTGNRNLEDVTFTAGETTGDFVVGFTAYDSANKSYAGVLTITVQQYAGDLDVVCITSRDTPLALSSKDFTAFWENQCPGGELQYIAFDRLPRSVDGALYLDYSAIGIAGDAVRIDDELYVTPNVRQYGIDTVTFVPSVGVKQADYISLDFTAYGLRSTGRSTTRSGLLYIFFSNDLKSADISVSVPAAGTTGAVLNPVSFRSAYEQMTGSTGSFYIQLLNVPASGALYLNRTTISNGIRLTSENIASRPFFYNGSTVETIGDLTYVPGTATSESIRYVASSAQGKPLFAGNINFTSSGTSSGTPVVSTGLAVNYTSPATGVTFQGSDFVNAQGVGQPTLTSVCFTPPSALYGTLYYGRSAVSAGSAITTGTNWFSTSTATITGLNYVDGISFVPALSYTSGTVTIPFNALTSAGTRVTGSVRITVGGSTVNSGTNTDPANNSTTTPGTVTPTVPANAKTFKDVPQASYYYSYVTALTTTGVLSGYEDGTFRPDNTVNLGEALKMIMTSAGYPEQPATTSEWASGYLALAKSEGLLPDGTIETLSRPVDRYTIAGIAARALHLQLSAAAVSPFADMAADSSAAPAVSALQQIGILVGSEKDGQMIYQGEYAIRRRDFAVIIWRLQNYVRTGNVNGDVYSNADSNAGSGVDSNVGSNVYNEDYGIG